MRATFLIAFLALAACKRSESQPTKASPAPERHGFIQEYDGHRLVVVQHGSKTYVIPFDEPVPGTLVVENGQVTPVQRGFKIPTIPGICPCCVRTCGSPCEPTAMPCAPLPGFGDWPGGFGRSFPE
jgi:hypothetical protein